MFNEKREEEEEEEEEKEDMGKGETQVCTEGSLKTNKEKKKTPCYN